MPSIKLAEVENTTGVIPTWSSRYMYGQRACAPGNGTVWQEMVSINFVMNLASWLPLMYTARRLDVIQ